MTALMLAAGKGHVIIVRMLLSEHLYRRKHRAAKGSLEPVPSTTFFVHVGLKNFDSDCSCFGFSFRCQ
jgi:hypothetical protein